VGASREETGRLTNRVSVPSVRATEGVTSLTRRNVESRGSRASGATFAARTLDLRIDSAIDVRTLGGDESRGV